MLDVVDKAVKLVTGLALGGEEGWNTLSDDLADSEPEANVITLSGYLKWKGGYVMFLPWTAPDCLLTSYDYGPDCIISHGLLSRGVISHVR